MTKKIVITGGAGFIGINAANYFLNKKYEVTIIDNFSRKGTRENVRWLLQKKHKQLKIVEADVVKDKKLLSTLFDNSDLVLHFAAQVAVTTSVDDPVHDFEVNARGTLNVLEALRKLKNPPVLIYSSTNKVYGDLNREELIETKTRYKFVNKKHGISEDQPLDFKSPYGCSKGSADQYVHDYHVIYGLKTVVFRQSCIYGTQQFGIEDQGWISWFIIAFLLGNTVRIYGDGKQVRDLLYIEDLIRAYDLAFQNIEKTNGQIYNIGGGVKNTSSVWPELQPILEKIFKKKLHVEFHNERPGDQKIFIADIRKAKKDFDWTPNVGIEEGVKRLFIWAKKNKASIKSLVDQKTV